METIGTHNGTFHCDEALACYMLKKLPRFANSPIIRSRDPQVLSQLTILVDVGDIYNASTLRFDHHQKGFFDTFSSNHATKLSSAGLIYKHFGREIISGMVPQLSHDENEMIYNKVYDSFIEGLDGIDNGVQPYRCSDDNCSAGVSRRYGINTDVSARIGRLNPAWNEVADDIEIDKRFMNAMEVVGSEFLDRVKSYAGIWLPGRQLVQDAIMKRMGNDSKGRIVIFEQYCPWKDHLHTIEKELNISEPILYVIYPDQSKTWRVQAVSTQPGVFTNRLPLPSSWCGIRDEKLVQVSGVDGCIFVHNSGFIGGNKTRIGALMMAKKSFEMQISQ